MSVYYGINFRDQDDSYVVDGTGESGMPRDFFGPNFPYDGDNGLRYGWDATQGIDGSNDSNSIDRRLAGFQQGKNTTDVSSIRINLPFAGQWLIRVAHGNALFPTADVYSEIFDDNSSLGVLIDQSGGTTAGNFYDASGVLRSAAAWPGSNVGVIKTFSSTILRYKIGRGATATGRTSINHLSIESIDPGITRIMAPKVSMYNARRMVVFPGVKVDMKFKQTNI